MTTKATQLLTMNNSYRKTFTSRTTSLQTKFQRKIINSLDLKLKILSSTTNDVRSRANGTAGKIYSPQKNTYYRFQVFVSRYSQTIAVFFKSYHWLITKLGCLELSFKHHRSNSDVKKAKKNND